MKVYEFCLKWGKPPMFYLGKKYLVLTELDCIWFHEKSFSNSFWKVHILSTIQGCNLFTGDLLFMQ